MKKYKAAIIFAVIIFIVCITYSFYFQVQPRGDERAYDAIALNFLKGNGFTEKLELDSYMDRAISYVGQGYIVFLASLYKIFGHHYSVVWIFQAFFHSLTSLLLFFICLNIFENKTSEKVGLLSMGLYGFWPDLIESTSMLLTEPLFLFLAVVSIYLVIKLLQKPDFKKALLLGLSVGIGSSIRLTLIIFALFFAILLILKKVKNWPIYSLLIIIIPIIIISAFMYRNYVQHNRFVFTTAGGYDLWVGNNVNANGEFEPSQEIRGYFEKNGFVYLDKKGISEVVKFALKEPIHFLKLQLIKTSKYFSLIRPTGWWPHLNKLGKGLTLFFSSLFWAFNIIFGISGAWYLLKKRGFIHKWLIYLAITGPLVVIPIVVGTRYRSQIYPFLAIFAAYFLAKFFFQRHLSHYQNYYKILLTIFIILSLNSVYDLITNFNVFLEHLKRII